MKNLLIFLFITGIFTPVSIPPVKNEIHKPYEATWMKLTKTDSGYIVYNYPNLNFEIQSPFKVIVKNDILTWITFYDTIRSFSCDRIQSLGNEKYYLPIEEGEHFQFNWFDKEKHIARWTVYYSDGERVQTQYLYIDSLYNTYPIVDFDWEDE